MSIYAQLAPSGNIRYPGWALKGNEAKQMQDLSKISVVLPSLDPDEKLIAVVDGLLESGGSWRTVPMASALSPWTATTSITLPIPTLAVNIC